MSGVAAPTKATRPVAGVLSSHAAAPAAAVLAPGIVAAVLFGLAAATANPIVGALAPSNRVTGAGGLGP
ncbi:MAG: hypothetical protein OHK0018_15470 [Erythrobacter tepidarius]